MSDYFYDEEADSELEFALREYCVITEHLLNVLTKQVDELPAEVSLAAATLARAITPLANAILAWKEMS